MTDEKNCATVRVYSSKFVERHIRILFAKLIYKIFLFSFYAWRKSSKSHSQSERARARTVEQTKKKREYRAHIISPKRLAKGVGKNRRKANRMQKVRTRDEWWAINREVYKNEMKIKLIPHIVILRKIWGLAFYLYIQIFVHSFGTSVMFFVCLFADFVHLPSFFFCWWRERERDSSSFSCSLVASSFFLFAQFILTFHIQRGGDDFNHVCLAIYFSFVLANHFFCLFVWFHVSWVHPFGCHAHSPKNTYIASERERDEIMVLFSMDYYFILVNIDVQMCVFSCAWMIEFDVYNMMRWYPLYEKKTS